MANNLWKRKCWDCDVILELYDEENTITEVNEYLECPECRKKFLSVTLCDADGKVMDAGLFSDKNAHLWHNKKARMK